MRQLPGGAAAAALATDSDTKAYCATKGADAGYIRCNGLPVTSGSVAAGGTRTLPSFSGLLLAPLVERFEGSCGRIFAS